jgi:hypothetical protein
MDTATASARTGSEECFWTAAQVASRWQVDRTTVYRHAGKPNGLASLLIGGARRFRPSDVRAYEEKHMVHPGGGSRVGRLLGGAA